MKIDLRFWKMKPKTVKELLMGMALTLLICSNVLALVWTFIELLTHYKTC